MVQFAVMVCFNFETTIARVTENARKRRGGTGWGGARRAAGEVRTMGRGRKSRRGASRRRGVAGVRAAAWGGKGRHGDRSAKRRRGGLGVGFLGWGEMGGMMEDGEAGWGAGEGRRGDRPAKLGLGGGQRGPRGGAFGLTRGVVGGMVPPMRTRPTFHAQSSMVALWCVFVRGNRGFWANGAGSAGQRKTPKTLAFSRVFGGLKMVARLGFEPRLTDPESAVLPLHHRAGNGTGR